MCEDTGDLVAMSKGLWGMVVVLEGQGDVVLMGEAVWDILLVVFFQN